MKADAAKNARRPPKGMPWVWLPLDLIESDAWRSASINVRRLLDFLMREHMRHGGAENGKLKAPQAQLRVYGIGARYIAQAIDDAITLGLVECRYADGQTRGVERCDKQERVPLIYTLTWLALHDGTAARDTWRTYRNVDLAPLPTPKSRKLPLKGNAALPLKGNADAPNLPLKGNADHPEKLPLKGKVLSRSSYQGRGNNTDGTAAGGAP